VAMRVSLVRNSEKENIKLVNGLKFPLERIFVQRRCIYYKRLVIYPCKKKKNR
jgi:hypothetical protein